MEEHCVNTVPPHAHICTAVPGDRGALEAVLVNWALKETIALQETSADQFSFPGLENEAIQPGGHQCLQYRQNEVDQICMWDSTSTLVGIPALHI